MRISPVLLLPLILTGTAAPLSASQDQPVDKPVTDQAVSAGDVVRTPFSDLNLRKGEIPELLIREISGANEQDRRLLLAVQAGFARRAFLKGFGQARGCRYPARAAVAVTAPPSATAKRPRGQKVQFTSQPVVQKVD